MNGEMEFNSTMKRIALTKRSLQIRMVTPNEYLYAFGQQGLSSHYTEVRLCRSALGPFLILIIIHSY